MSVIWQGPIHEELHDIGLDLSENGSAETVTDEGVIFDKKMIHKLNC